MVIPESTEVEQKSTNLGENKKREWGQQKYEWTKKKKQECKERTI
jgi:hypothetical protein